ncbi:MAG: hypothetical protein WAW37_04210, partial [Syntrophobacteraceae bacterium]
SRVEYHRAGIPATGMPAPLFLLTFTAEDAAQPYGRNKKPKSIHCGDAEPVEMKTGLIKALALRGPNLSAQCSSAFSAPLR